MNVDITKIAKWVGSFVAICTGVGVLWAFVLSLVLNNTDFGTELKKTIDFGKQAEQHILPAASAEHDDFEDRISALEEYVEDKKKSGYAIGLRFSTATSKTEYRDSEGRWHEAHKVEGQWFYFDKGKWKRVYP